MKRKFDFLLKNLITSFERVVLFCSNLKDIFCFLQRNPEYKPCYKGAKKTHIKLVRDSKKFFCQNRIFSSDNTTKTYWQAVNQIEKFCKRKTLRWAIIEMNRLMIQRLRQIFLMNFLKMPQTKF